MNAPVYNAGNPFRKKMFKRLGLWNLARGAKLFGKSVRGNEYAHLLSPDEERLNFYSDEIFEAANRR
ncbi:MAG: hypothetical protein GY822_03490, partial [Deltaproteobacteria bacterium]|nr:hypothetical protein [Deltaproteobacteria bacterium]